MTKKSSATVVGLFTLVGIILSVFTLMILGSGKYFEKNHKVSLYFEKSVYGLQVGSDVRLGGVRIGRVSSISVMIDTKQNRKVIPVIVELTDKELRKVSATGVGMINFTSRDGVKRAVKAGLRAGMKQESLVTGQLYVEFDIAPQVEGFVYDSELKNVYPVVPTIPTKTDELISGISDGFKKINSLDLEGMITEIRLTLKDFSKQVELLEVKRINDNLVGLTENMKELSSDQKLIDAVTNLNAALVEVKQVSAKLNEGIDPLFEDIQKVVASSERSLMAINKAAQEIQSFSDPQSPTLLSLKNLIHETETTSRALKELANDLKRSPNSLLRGKKKSP